MVKISRYFLVIIAIIAFGVVLPKLYWVAFAKPIRVPLINYSCTDNNFILFHPGAAVKRCNSDGEELTREQYETKLPLMHTRQLLMNETMPDSINGVEMDMHEISENQSIFRVKPREIRTPQATLFPLFESQSGHAKLEMPDDFFRITWRMEFINAETNKIDEEKSRMFSAVLYKRGFKFPAKTINGLPTTRKSCDEGYLVVDAEDQLFNIKQITGRPFVRKIKIPDGIKFKRIECVDFKDQFYYAYLFSTDNKLYVLTQYDYLLEKLDVEDINPELNEIRIYGDLFNYNVISIGSGFINCQVLDKSYHKVDEYKETWLVRKQRIEGKVAQFLFPAQLKMTDSNSNYIRFFFETNQSFYWIISSLLFMFIHFVLLKIRGIKSSTHSIDFVIIAISGIFGFLAVNIFPNKFIE